MCIIIRQVLIPVFIYIAIAYREVPKLSTPLPKGGVLNFIALSQDRPLFKIPNFNRSRNIKKQMLITYLNIDANKP
jgi:hypothetical protein